MCILTRAKERLTAAVCGFSGTIKLRDNRFTVNPVKTRRISCRGCISRRYVDYRYIGHGV